MNACYSFCRLTSYLFSMKAKRQRDREEQVEEAEEHERRKKWLSKNLLDAEPRERKKKSP